MQAPPWAHFDRIEVYANGLPAPDAKSDVPSPYLFSAGPPAVTLLEGDCDPATPTARTATSTSTIVTSPGPGRRAPGGHADGALHGADQDTWFVVVVRGTDGVCEPMFPVHPRSLNTTGNTTLANLLDGNLGRERHHGARA